MLKYRKLTVWNLAKNLAVEVYGVTGKFPPAEKFGLTSQMNRAAVSVASNIAEGTSRQTARDQVRFIEMSYGSLMELSCQLDIALDLGFVGTEDYDRVQLLITDLSVRLANYRNAVADRV